MWVLAVETRCGELGCCEFRVCAAVVVALVEILASMWPVQSLAQVFTLGPLK